MLFLVEKYGGAGTTKAIVANGGRGIAGINNALFARGLLVEVNDIFKNWVVANYLNDSSISGGIYGYSASFSGIPHSRETLPSPRRSAVTLHREMGR